MPATETKAQVDAYIRWFSPKRDIREALEIERESYEKPWDYAEFVEQLGSRKVSGLVADLEGEVIGYIIYDALPKQIDILNIAVKGAYRRRGIASQLLERLIDVLAPKSAAKVTAEVRESNLSAQLLLKSLGFRWTKTLPKYYDDLPEDAYLMEYLT